MAAAPDGLAGTDGYQVTAQLINLPADLMLDALADTDHRHYRHHADDHAEHRQEAAQLGGLEHRQCHADITER